MKIITSRLSSFLIAVCSTLLSLLGYSCSSNPEDMPDMYGMPVGDFEIKGAVTDEDGNKVSEAEIRVTYPDAPSGVFRFGVTSTDKNGSYEISGHELVPEIKVVCIPDDVSLQPDSTVVELNYKGGDKNNFWDVGHAEATVDFTLKPQE